MFAISKKLRAIERGHWNSPLQIRKNDDLKYLARTFNNAIEALVYQGQDMLNRIESMEQDLQSLNVSKNNDLASITRHVDALKQILTSKIKPQTGHHTP
jgi:nitrate/nitrite-specific signal transduction histidine kinase